MRITARFQRKLATRQERAGALCGARPGRNLVSHARHRVGGHILAVPEGEAGMGAFDLEAELLVERDARGVSEVQKR